MLARSAALVGLSVVLVACGGSTDPGDSGAKAYQLCDGSSQLRFGYQMLGGGETTPGQTFLAQNGFAFLFVNGACQYWAFGGTGAGEAGYWQAVHTGTLSAEQGVALSSDLELSNWPDDDTPAGACMDGSGASWWRDGDVFTGVPCGGGPSAPLNAKTVPWIQSLWSAGTPVETPLRLQALVAPSDWPAPSAAASVSLELASIAVPMWPPPSENAPGVLIDDPALVAELRALRPDGASDTYGDHQLPVLQNGVLYWLFFRDVVPLEDSNGLIRPPH